LALAVVAPAVSHRIGAPLSAWFALLPVLAGAGTAWQQAVNGLVAAAHGPVVRHTHECSRPHWSTSVWEPPRRP
jgi:hypothetical protein